MIVFFMQITSKKQKLNQDREKKVTLTLKANTCDFLFLDKSI